MGKNKKFVERVNILYLDRDPVKAAKMHCDKDLVSQPLQVASILATACHQHGVKNVPFKATHKTYPPVLWAMEARDNYLWVWEHFCALLLEYKRRYGRHHIFFNLKHHEFFYENMPEQIASKNVYSVFPRCFMGKMAYESIPNPVKAFRTYYVNEKPDAQWHSSEIPEWFSKIVKPLTEEELNLKPKSYEQIAGFSTEEDEDFED